MVCERDMNVPLHPSPRIWMQPFRGGALPKGAFLIGKLGETGWRSHILRWPGLTTG